MRMGQPFEMIGEQARIDQLQSDLRSRHIRLVSVVRNASSWDLAISNPIGRLSVARIVSHARERDYAALATMLSQGDFDRAILVCFENDHSDRTGDIETHWIGDIDTLAASLARGDAPS